MSIPPLPHLSLTYQSSYLWSPQHLRRVTINEEHYHKYVAHTLNSEPPHLHALSRRVQRYGDNRFNLHRDIPIQQDYSLTELRLSQLRPWDQLVDRPLSKSSRVVQKEVWLPFPAEHPYTSHISQCAVFPDTHTSHPHTGTTSRSYTHHDVGTQMTVVAPYFVKEKAAETGMRKEQHQLFLPGRGHVINRLDHVTQHCGCGQLWDIPRSRRHQRSQTYPAPMLQYTPSQFTPSTISPHTQDALKTINSLTSNTTSYKDHFGIPPSHGVLNKTTLRRNSTVGGQILKESRPQYSAYSHCRPYTAESRAKYRGKSGRGEEWEENEEEGWGEGEREGAGEREGEKESRIVTKDAATQTEPNDYLLLITPSPPQDHSEKTESTKDDHMQTKECPTIIVARPPRSATTDHKHQRSYSADQTVSLPRTSSSSRRFSSLYGFSRSAVLKRFHSQYPEQAPDLRQYGMKKGRRHTIHGYNSYYFH